jgi:hypothetical protein
MKSKVDSNSCSDSGACSTRPVYFYAKENSERLQLLSLTETSRNEGKVRGCWRTGAVTNIRHKTWGYILAWHLYNEVTVCPEVRRSVLNTRYAKWREGQTIWAPVCVMTRSICKFVTTNKTVGYSSFPVTASFDVCKVLFICSSYNGEIITLLTYRSNPCN